MDIFDTINTQATAMRLPLYAVTLSAVARKRTPALLILHWHGFHRAAALRIPGVPIPPRSVAGSALRLQTDWDDVEDWDRQLLDAAWRTGAWDLERTTHRPWWRLNAPLAETLACHRAFGVYSEADDQIMRTDEDEDPSDLLEMAARYGYIRWLFRPRAHGLWARLQEDDATLAPSQSREPPCPVPPAPFDRHRAGRRLYRLGRGTRILL